MKQTTLTPSQTLLCKLGSIVVHTEEMLSPDGREFDRVSIQILLQEPDV